MERVKALETQPEAFAIPHRVFAVWAVSP